MVADVADYWGPAIPFSNFLAATALDLRHDCVRNEEDDVAVGMHSAAALAAVVV